MSKKCILYKNALYEVPKLVNVAMKTFKVKKLPFTQENIDKYKTKRSTLPWNKKPNDHTNMLKHARFIEGVTDGLFLVNDTDDSLIGYISWEGSEITSIEVSDRYQRLGYATYLLDKAISAGCTNLTVNRKNSAAISLYLKYGFRFTKSKSRINFKMVLKDDK